MNEFEWKKHADDAIQEIENFIDIESQFIRTTHGLLSALLGLDYVFAHLDEITPQEHDLHQLMGRISELLSDIKEIIESDESKEIQFKEEEERIIAILKYAEGHRKWVAVRKTTEAEKNLENMAIRLEEEELRDLHTRFRKIKRLVERAEYNETNEQVSYYLTKLIKILKAYERILWHLLRKEKIVKKKLKKSR